ncbi:hypothetical protein AB0M36_33965 [Actinoplanes sp. NPDC051346]|uniref:hypothetical protein n=1 Tax=Actinoplanes sp. NPDC051346 TaxID=3155048 RepID=UPI003412A1B3
MPPVRVAGHAVTPHPPVAVALRADLGRRPSPAPPDTPGDHEVAESSLAKSRVGEEDGSMALTTAAL